MKSKFLSKTSALCGFALWRHSLFERGFFITITAILCPVRYEFIHKTLWPFWISFWSCCLSFDLFTRIRASLTRMYFTTGDTRWTTAYKKASIWWRGFRASADNSAGAKCLEREEDTVICFVVWEFEIGEQSKKQEFGCKTQAHSSTARDTCQALSSWALWRRWN